MLDFSLKTLVEKTNSSNKLAHLYMTMALTSACRPPIILELFDWTSRAKNLFDRSILK